MIDTATSTHEGLRVWARGMYPLEAGVELLIRTGLAQPWQPWIKPTDRPDMYWVDVDQLHDDMIGPYSGGQIRLLHIAASLLDGAPVNLHRDIAGLDRGNLELVLAAIAHAGGSHEHSGDLGPDPNGRLVGHDGVRMGFTKLGSLYPWPQD